MGLSMSTVCRPLGMFSLRFLPMVRRRGRLTGWGKGCIRVAPHRSSSNFVRGHGKSAVIPLFTCCWRSRRRSPNLRPTATATANGGQRVAFTVAAFAPSLGSGPRQGERARRPR